MKLTKKINIILAAIVTIALLYFLFSNVSISSIISTIRGISWAIILSGFLLYIASYFFRALRFWLLLDRRISLKKLFSITAVHNLANSILPARTGELSYVYLVRKTKKATATEGIATLVVARIFDFLSVALIFFLSIFLAQGLPSYVTGAARIIALFCFVLVAFIAGLILFSSSAEKVLARIELFFEKSGSRWMHYLSKKMKEVIIDLKIVRSRDIILSTLIISLLIWFLNYIMCYLLVIGMGLSAGIWAVFAAFSLLVFVNILPISISGFGTIEGTWAVAFMSFGIEKKLAISSGFGFHIMLILYFLVLGAYGFLTLKRKD